MQVCAALVCKNNTLQKSDFWDQFYMCINTQLCYNLSNKIRDDAHDDGLPNDCPQPAAPVVALKFECRVNNTMLVSTLPLCAVAPL